jgi:Fe-S cluster biosynthesis and repair protein YggX
MLRQQDLYHLYAGIRERLHEIMINERHPDPMQGQVRREMAEELLEYLHSTENGLKTMQGYKEQWTRGENE